MKKIKKVKPVKVTKAEKKKLWMILYGVLVLVLGLEFFNEPHPHFGIDGTPLFFAWYGFISCIAIIVISKSLGLLIKRPEGYYEGDD